MGRQPKVRRQASSGRTIKSTPKWLRPLVFGLSIFLIISWLSRKTADADTWWHLKTGQFILSQHRLPVPDPFAWTTYLGKPVYAGEEITRYFNLTHEWLAQAALYGVYVAGGTTGLVLLRAICLSLFCALAGLLTYRRTMSIYSALAATGLCAVVMHSFPEDRPQYFTYVFVAVTINLLDARRMLWLLPPLFLIWANSHGGFILGWIVVGIYCAEDLYYRWRGGPESPGLALWFAGLLALLLSGLNPNGFRVFQVLLNYSKSPLQSQIVEWYHPNLLEVSPFTFLLYGGLLTLILRRRKVRPAEWLLYLAFATAGVLAWRNVVFTAWIGAVLIVAYLPDWRRIKNRLSLEYALAGLLLATTIGVIIEGQALRFLHGIDTPVAGAADFLLQHNVRGKLFNTYAEGGYLIWRVWPQLQVFADGRALNESVAQDLQRIILAADDPQGRSFEEVLNAYGADVIAMNAVEPISGQAYYLPVALADPEQKEWKLVFYDAHELIYMRHPPPDLQLPNQLDGLVGMEQQCWSWISAGANACTRGMVDVFTRIGDEERASKWAEIARKHSAE
jgi:hypothetical protein